jgi:two-component system, NarL family, response regulator DegU
VHILVVDDFQPWQRFVMQILESESDLRVISVASDGQEAVQQAKRWQPDLILMDVSLPKMNGYEATHEIRSFAQTCKILFVSEHRSDELVEAAFNADACGYVLKSDSYSDLIPGIRAALLNRRFVSRSLRHWRKSSRPQGGRGQADE